MFETNPCSFPHLHHKSSIQAVRSLLSSSGLSLLAQVFPNFAISSLVPVARNCLVVSGVSLRWVNMLNAVISKLLILSNVGSVYSYEYFSMFSFRLQPIWVYLPLVSRTHRDFIKSPIEFHISFLQFWYWSLSAKCFHCLHGYFVLSTKTQFCGSVSSSELVHRNTIYINPQLAVYPLQRKCF